MRDTNLATRKDTATPDKDEIRRAIAAQWRPGDVHEIRCLGRNKYDNHGGYFSDPDKAAEYAFKQSVEGRNVYATCNPCKPELLSRRTNRGAKLGNSDATSDADIDRRTTFAIDVDPDRPAGIAATDEQHTGARERAERIAAELTAEYGWPTPELDDSGNGALLRYAVDEPNDAATTRLFSLVLAELDKRYTDSAAKIDRSVGNAARIFRIPGGVNHKGDPSAERPHRMAKILRLPATPEILTRAKLEALVPDAEPFSDDSSTDLGAWLESHNVAIDKHGPYTNANGARYRYRLETCPLCGESDASAVVLEFEGGRRGYKCHHNRCSGKGWRDFRKAVAPGEFPRRNLTDLGNGERLADQHGDKLKYAPEYPKYFAWDGTRWAPDATLQAERLADDTARSIYAEAAAEKDQTRRELVSKWAVSSESLNRRRAMLESARPMLAVAKETFDAHAWKINCQNGTVDLHTGKLHPHNSADLISMIAGTAIAEHGIAPQRFLSFLGEIFDGDDSLIAYMQRLLGYSLIGDVQEHILPVWYGSGANGKGTLAETIAAVFGDYAWKSPHSLLMATKHPPHPTALSDLFRRRFVLVSETDNGERFNEPVVKELTGGDSIAARRMRENFWTFTPSHTLALLTNHRPSVNGADEAMWRRLRLIPFNVTIPKERQDGTLPAKLKAEGPAILRWLVDGCLTWQLTGLQDPPCVLAATADYRAESDVFSRWFAECCELDTHAKTSAGDAYRSYENFARGESALADSKTAFGTRLNKVPGVGKGRNMSGRLYPGLRLKTAFDVGYVPPSALSLHEALP